MSQVRSIFLGTPRFAELILRRLAASPYRPELVITEPDRPAGRHQAMTAPAVKLAASELGLPVVQPNRASQLADLLLANRPDVAIVAAYGRLLTQSMLASAQHGFLNVHPSLLPQYRGATPIQAALLAGDEQTGVTIMQLDTGLDTGPILATKTVTIQATDTLPSLTDTLAELGGELLLDCLPAYLAGRLEPIPQPTTQISVTKRLTKEDGRLRGGESAPEIMRRLRAYQPWPGVWCELDGQRILLHGAALTAGQIIPTRLQLGGKQPVDWETFRRDRRALADRLLALLNSAR